MLFRIPFHVGVNIDFNLFFLQTEINNDFTIDKSFYMLFDSSLTW